MTDDDDFEREHPSYGILHIARTSNGSSAIRLFGSPLATHYGTIRLSISSGKWLHGLHHDRYFGMNKDFIEIEMSAAQFADAITSLNIGSGTPCTIRYVDGQRIQDPPEYATEAEHIRDNFENSLDSMAAKATTYADKIRMRGHLKPLWWTIDDHDGSNYVVGHGQYTVAIATLSSQTLADARQEFAAGYNFFAPLLEGIGPRDPSDFGGRMDTFEHAEYMANFWMARAQALQLGEASPHPSPSPRDLHVGANVTMLLRVHARVADRHDSHGRCYKLEIQQRDFAHSTRDVWVDDHEIIASTKNP